VLVANGLERAQGLNRPAVLLIHGGELPEAPDDILDPTRLGTQIPGSFIVDRRGVADGFVGEDIRLCEDMSGDGIAEVVLLFKGLAANVPGRVSVVFGSGAFSTVVDLVDLGGAVGGFDFEADRPVQEAASLGDIDNDGFGELGVTLAAASGFSCFLIRGGSDLAARLRPADLTEGRGVTFPRLEAIEGAGDVNGDGFDDILLRPPGSVAPFAPGEAFLLLGRPLDQLPESIDPDAFRAEDLGVIVVAPYDAQSAGGSGTTHPSFSFASRRDIAGDGRSELLLGVPSSHAYMGPVVVAKGGVAYFLRGGNLPETLETTDVARDHGVEIVGGEPAGQLGLRLAFAGDFDGDGREELLIASSFRGCEHPDRTEDLQLRVVSGAVLESPKGPTLTRIFPERGPSGGGQRVVLFGKGFGPSPRVFFAAQEASSVDVLGEGIAVAETPPRGASGPVQVRVEWPDRTSSEGVTYEYVRGETIRLSEAGARNLTIRHSASRPSSLRGAVVGDFNDDGFEDVAIADHHTDPSPRSELHLVFGQSTTDLRVDLDSPVAGTSSTIVLTRGGGSPFNLSAGDLDADGFDDLVLRLSLGAPGALLDHWRIVFGRESFPQSADLEVLGGTVSIRTESPDLQLGAAAIVPDTSGDGVSDLLLAANRADRTLLHSVRGGPDLADVESFPSSSLFLEEIAEAGYGAVLEADIDLSEAAGSAGDFNGDGVGDVYFAGSGVIQTGAVAVVYGNPILFSGRVVTLRGAFFGDVGGLLISGPTLLSGLKIAAAAPGNLDGDRDAGLFIHQTDSRTCTLTARAGRGVILDHQSALAMIFFGERPSLVEEIWAGRLAGPPDFYLPSEPNPESGILWLENHVAAEAFGSSAAAAGDFDGDGSADLLLGAPGSSSLTPVPGAAYVLRGGDFPESGRVDFPDAGELSIGLFESPASNGLGLLLDGEFDCNRDGVDDILVANARDTVYVVTGAVRSDRLFVRGDANEDGRLEHSDAVSVFSYLFLGGPGPCEDALDADDRGSIEITDGIYVLGFLFLGGPAPPPPFPDAGSDPTADDLDCQGF
jgi:hypothetical protein